MLAKSCSYFKSLSVQLLLFLTVNALFILKYFDRAGINPYISLSVYVVFIISFIFLYQRLSSKISEKIYKSIFFLLIIAIIIAIVTLFIAIDPYTIRVDRWSALSFFWDNIFRGDYPYAAHTHVSKGNFASPFPLWHLISLPFYLLGDVGLGIIFFLILLCFTLKYYFNSYQEALFFLLLLSLSPGYWWEVSARSDSLSNALLVFMIILWFSKTKRTLSNNLLLSIIICGSIAATRMSAIIPLAIFFFRPYLNLTTKQKFIFPIASLLVALLYFLPFIFWDTENWVFFSRNPFMSQTGNGNIYILAFMLILGIIASLNWKNELHYLWVTSIFIFLFILSNQIFQIINAGQGNLFSDGVSDISYFNLSLPYCLAFLTKTKS